MAKRISSALLTSSLFLLTSSLAASAAIPVRWTVDTFRVKPLVYDCYHGETLDLAAAMTAYGEPLDLHGKTARLYWQTNGMDQTYWSTNATVTTSLPTTNYQLPTTNVLSATFSGAYDPGVNSVIGFIGVDGENYRAAFQLNFRPSPGFTPAHISPPVKVLDFATTQVTHPEAAPFVMKGGAGGIDAATAGTIATNTVDAKVALWAMAGQPKPSGGADTNVVNDLVATYVTTNAATTNLTARLAEKLDASYPNFPGTDPSLRWDGNTLYGALCSLHIGDGDIKTLFGDFNAQQGWSHYKSVNQTLTNYLDSLSWRTTGNRSLSDYGITNETSGAGISAIEATNIVESAAVTNGGAKAYADATFVKNSLTGFELNAGNRINWMALDGWVFQPYGDIGYALNWSSLGDPGHENSFRFRNKINNIYYSSHLRADGSPIVTSNMMNRAVMNAISYNCLIVTNDEWHGKKHIGDFWVEGEFGAKRDITIYANRYEDNPKLTFSTVWPANLYMEYYYDEPTDKAGISFATTSYFSPTTVTSTLLPDGSRVATSNMVNNVFSANADYVLTNLTDGAFWLKSGEIGNYETTTNLTLRLDFSDAANRSGDCLLFLVNADDTEEHTITVAPTSLDVRGIGDDYLTAAKATTNLFMFSRIKANTIVVSKQELK